MAQATDVTVSRLARLLEFAAPAPGDICLDLGYGGADLAAALGPRVRHLTSIDLVPVPATTTPDLGPAARAARHAPDPGLRHLPDPAGAPPGLRHGPVSEAPGVPAEIRRMPGKHAREVPAEPLGVRKEATRSRPDHGADDGRMPTVFFGRGQRTLVRGAARLRADARSLPCRDSAFSLVTCRSALYRLNDPHAALREMLRVCRPGGRLVIADLVRPNSGTLDRDNLERLRDPEHPPTPSIARVVELVTQAGGDIRELEVRTVECPVASWLGDAADTGAAQRIRAALVNEVDGGPRTGAKPRIIGGELWITQRWIHLAATPIRAHAASESVIMQ